MISTVYTWVLSRPSFASITLQFVWDSWRCDSNDEFQYAVYVIQYAFSDGFQYTSSDEWMLSCWHRFCWVAVLVLVGWVYTVIYPIWNILETFGQSLEGPKPLLLVRSGGGHTCDNALFRTVVDVRGSPESLNKTETLSCGKILHRRILYVHFHSYGVVQVWFGENLSWFWISVQYPMTDCWSSLRVGQST